MIYKSEPFSFGIGRETKFVRCENNCGEKVDLPHVYEISVSSSKDSTNAEIIHCSQSEPTEEHPYLEWHEIQITFNYKVA